MHAVTMGRGRKDILRVCAVGGCLAATAFAVVSGCRRESAEAEPVPAGERFEFDDFYHAESGTWELETPVDLLKEQKYVSGEAERQQFLIYAAVPPEVVVIRESDGRWKRIDVIKGERVTATGWIDANRKQAHLVE